MNVPIKCLPVKSVSRHPFCIGLDVLPTGTEGDILAINHLEFHTMLVEFVVVEVASSIRLRNPPTKVE